MSHFPYNVIGSPEETPSTDVEGATARTMVSMMKGIKNYLKTLVAGGIGTSVTGSVNATLVASEVHAGQVGGHTACIDVTPTLTSAGAYAANDFVGADDDAITIAGCARVNGGTGIIIGAVLIDYALQSVAGELWLFDTEPTVAIHDNAAWSIADAQMLKCIGVIPFTTYYASAVNSVSPVGNLSIGFKCEAASTSLFACFVTRGTPTYAVGDLTFRLRVLQD